MTSPNFEFQERIYSDLDEALGVSEGYRGPAELMVSTINLPVDEEGCLLAGRILGLRDRGHRLIRPLLGGRHYDLASYPQATAK